MEYSFLAARLSFTFDVHMCVFHLANKLCCCCCCSRVMVGHRRRQQETAKQNLKGFFCTSRSEAAVASK